MAKDKKSVGEWGVFLQGAMLSLGTYVVCMFVLALMLVKGILPQEIEMAIVTGGAFFASMLGGIASSNGSSLGRFPASMISAGVFAIILITVGLIGWRETFWGGSSAVLLVCVMAGGVVAGLWSARKRKPRKQRGKRRGVRSKV